MTHDLERIPVSHEAGVSDNGRYVGHPIHAALHPKP
jgi:hypothetical protein